MRAFLALTAAGLLAGCQSAPAGPVTETGELATGDRTLVQGELIDSYTFQMREGQCLKVDLRSTAFDPYLILRTPGGQNSDNDDTTPGDRETSQIIYRAAESGQFEIGVTSYEGGESGAYTLVYEVTDTQPQGTVTGSDSTATAGSAPAERGQAGEAAPPDAAPAEADTAGEGGVKI